MQNLQLLIAEFHDKFGHPNHTGVHIENLRNEALANLRLNLMSEEITEGEDAELILDDVEQDEYAKQAAVIEIFDSLVDVAVITLGTACAYGLRLDSNEPSEELVEKLVDNPSILGPIRAEFKTLEQNLTDLVTFPLTKAYLASAVLRNLQDILDNCIATATVLGFPFERGFVEVHASNMSKLGADGKPIYREDGKILKGPNYFKANLEKVLNDYHLELT